MKRGIITFYLLAVLSLSVFTGKVVLAENEFNNNILEDKEIFLECDINDNCDREEVCNPETNHCEKCKVVGEISSSDSLCFIGSFVGSDGRCTFCDMSLGMFCDNPDRIL